MCGSPARGSSHRGGPVGGHAGRRDLESAQHHVVPGVLPQAPLIGLLGDQVRPPAMFSFHGGLFTGQFVEV
jgi:hypothetical protein